MGRAGELSADLLPELQTELEAARESPQDEGHVAAVRDIAEKLNIPLVRAEHMLTSLEAQPTVTRELMMRRIAEAWLEGQRRAYRDSFSPHCLGAGEDGAQL